jgi:uridine kinase
LLREHLAQLRAGRAIDRPCYSFALHARVGTELVVPAPVLVVEGLFALYWPEVRELLDLRIFVDAPSDVRLARRIDRDVRERGRTRASVMNQFRATVQPAHELYVEPTRQYADLVLSSMSDLDSCAAALLRATDRLTRTPGTIR